MSKRNVNKKDTLLLSFTKSNCHESNEFAETVSHRFLERSEILLLELDGLAAAAVQLERLDREHRIRKS